MFGDSIIWMALPVNYVTLTGSINLFQAPAQDNAAPWWLFWLLAIISLLAALVWWVVERREPEATPSASLGLAPVAQAEAVPAPPPPETPPPAPDKLTRIEGIGPKISEVLQSAGITTFAQLAATEVNRIQEILEASDLNLRLADPTTWPEQAQLAAQGDWEALEKLQDELKGGRRVE